MYDGEKKHRDGKQRKDIYNFEDRQIPPEKKKMFLRVVACTGSDTLAAEVIDVPIETMYVLKLQDDDFSDEWERAFRTSLFGKVMDSAIRLAKSGTKRGERMLKFLLKTAMRSRREEDARMEQKASRDDGDSLVAALERAEERERQNRE